MQVEIKAMLTTKVNNQSNVIQVLNPESEVSTILTTNESATGIEPKIEDTDVTITIPVNNDTFTPVVAKLPITSVHNVTPTPTTLAYSYTLPSATIDTPVVPLSVGITCTTLTGSPVSIRVSEDITLPAGTLISDSILFVSGNINYETGNVTLTFTEELDPTIDIINTYAYYSIVTLFSLPTSIDKKIIVNINYNELKHYIERTKKQELRLIDSMTSVL